jgi:hypothetical protein
VRTQGIPRLRVGIPKARKGDFWMEGGYPGHLSLAHRATSRLGPSSPNAEAPTHPRLARERTTSKGGA